MDHVVFLDHKARELENLRSGAKTMLIRGAMGRKLPHGRVAVGDMLYFIRNNGEGLIQARARVESVLHSDKLSAEDSQALVTQHEKELLLDARLTKRFSGKRYIVLISVMDMEDLPPFTIDRSGYKNMDDWLPVGNVENVRQ